MVTTLTIWAILPLVACEPSAPIRVGAPRDTDAEETGMVTGAEVRIHEVIGSIPVVSWTQATEANSWIEYSYDEGEWHQSPKKSRSAGEAEELALGVPYELDVTLRIHWTKGDDSGQSNELTIQTDKAPSGAPEVMSVSGDETLWDPSTPFVLTSIYGNSPTVDGSWTFIIDRQGRLVWSLEAAPSRLTLHSQGSYDGTEILIDQNSFWSTFDLGAQSQVWRVKIDGSVVKRVATPYAHHPFTEMPDGSIAWAAADHYYNDSIMTVDPQGKVSTVWECADFHDSIGETEYCGANTLYWHEPTQSFLFSVYSTDSIIEVDLASGQATRWFGSLAGAYTFDPADSKFYWQHGVHYTDAGTLLVSTRSGKYDEETVVREFQIDEVNQTLTEVWSFGEGLDVYGHEMGEAEFLPNGNILHNYGTTPRIREGTPTGEVVWDVRWNADFIGRHTPLGDLYALAPE
jgi:hypothetical protein